jgi:hypothetical protein
MAVGLNLKQHMIKLVNMDNNTEIKEKNSMKEFFGLGEVAGYFFRKKDAGRPSNFNIRSMHVINKISITIFLLGVLYLIFKNFF